MRRLVINLDDELDLWLSKQTNQNETVRKALELYKGDITTDTVQGLRESYKVLRNDIQAGFDAQGEVNLLVDKLIDFLEMRDKY